MAITYYKITMFFSMDSYGWSESWVVQSASPLDLLSVFNAWGQPLANQRSGVACQCGYD